MRSRTLPVVRGFKGVLPWVHIDNAKTATVTSIERGSARKVHNIVDNEPVGMNEWLLFAARSIGAPRPFSVPVWLPRLLMPYVGAIFSTWLAADNAKARNDLGWELRFPSYREGLKELQLNAP